MHRTLSTSMIPRATLLATALLHGNAAGASAPAAAVPIDPTATTASTTLTVPGQPKMPELAMTHYETRCSGIGKYTDQIACFSQIKWNEENTRKKTPGGTDECTITLKTGRRVNACALRDPDLALAAWIVAPGELALVYEHFTNKPPGEKQGIVIPAAGAAVLKAIKSVWKDAAPAINEYVKRRLKHERRARIVAVLEDGPCADDGGLRLFKATCAAVDVYAAASRGAVISLAILSRAAREDLTHLNASVITREYHSRLKPSPEIPAPEEAQVAIAVDALITEALLDNKDASIVDPLAAALPGLPEACALQLLAYGEKLAKQLGAGEQAPVTTIFWSGLTVLTSCEGATVRDADASNLQQVIANATKYTSSEVKRAEPLLEVYTNAAAETENPPFVKAGPPPAANTVVGPADEPKPASATTPTAAAKPSTEPHPANKKQVPAGLRHLALRLRTSAAIADIFRGSGGAWDDGGAWLRGFADSLDITAAIVVEDYKEAAARAIWRMHSSGLGYQIRHIDMIVVLATETDEAIMESTLANAAVPAVSWRVKSRTRAFNITLSAMAGVQTAIEFRQGAYGSTLETLKTRHFQAPTLQLPLGFDISWGNGWNSVGLFISTIDPLAFLQYDVARQGRLPGPSVLTALAPGLGVRIGLGRSPLSLMPFIAFRPRFRAWEPSIAGPGAHALQVGLALTFDVVLYSFVSKRWK